MARNDRAKISVPRPVPGCAEALRQLSSYFLASLR
jgi:hypothetical protein